MAARHNLKKDKRPPKEKAEAGRGEPTLSVDRIIETAVALLDAEGVAGLTMRRLADALGCGVMSLYWHVKSKEEVLRLALDSVLVYRDGTDVAESDRNWRDEVFAVLSDWREAILRHPWTASLLAHQAMGPNVLQRLDLLIRILARAGIPERDMNTAIWALWNYVMGATMTRASFDLSDADREAAQQYLDEIGNRYPAIGRSGLILDDDWDGVFRRGLGFLLDGLESRQRV